MGAGAQRRGAEATRDDTGAAGVMRSGAVVAVLALRVGEAAQLRDRLPLELADPLGGDAVPGTDVGQLVLASVDQAVARPDDVGGPVVELADQIPGCRGVDAGPLRLARQLEGFTAVIVGINRRHKIHAGLRISRLGDDKRRRLNAELRPAGDREEGP